MISTVAISGYRSLVDVVIGLKQLTVITGSNGSGKSNLYRALRLIQGTAHPSPIAAITREGGLDSVLWAGPQKPAGPGAQGTVRHGPVALQLGFASDELGYLVDVGLPQAGSSSLFLRDAEIKREQIFAGPFPRPASLLVDRLRGHTRIRNRHWIASDQTLAPHQGMLTSLGDGDASVELLRLRRILSAWRFYDQLRTDSHAPARQPQVGTRTEALADDGSDIASMWQSSTEAGLQQMLDGHVDRAFPGSRVSIANDGGYFQLRLHQPGLLRPLSAAELSEGTLRYLLLCAALIGPTPPPLLVLNEPEASLHTDLLEPLAELILTASTRTQVVVVTHARGLASALEQAHHVELINEGYGTHIVGQSVLDRPAWNWGSR